jgi:hypothetical protein
MRIEKLKSHCSAKSPTQIACVNEPLRIVYIGDVKRDNTSNSDTHLLTLANRNDPICVASSKVAKASTISVAVANIISGVISLTFANVNTA